jgi:hypothetical protein
MYEQDFNSTILNLFDKVLFPIHRAGRPAQLASKALDMTRDATKPFNGEEQIEKTLTSNPLKLFLDVEKEFDAIRDKAHLAWPNGIQEELSQPVAALLSEGTEVIAVASQAGYRCFTTVAEFKRYVQAEILVQEAQS